MPRQCIRAGALCRYDKHPYDELTRSAASLTEVCPKLGTFLPLHVWYGRACCCCMSNLHGEGTAADCAAAVGCLVAWVCTPSFREGRLLL